MSLKAPSIHNICTTNFLFEENIDILCLLSMELYIFKEPSKTFFALKLFQPKMKLFLSYVSYLFHVLYVVLETIHFYLWNAIYEHIKNSKDSVTFKEKTYSSEISRHSKKLADSIWWQLSKDSRACSLRVVETIGNEKF